VHALRGVDLKVGRASSSPSSAVGQRQVDAAQHDRRPRRPTAGTILMEQQDISRMNKNQLAEVRRHVGFVFQYFNLIGRLTALQNVELPMTIKG